MPMADGALFVPGKFMSAADIRAAVASGHPGTRLVAEGKTSPNRGAGPARYWSVQPADGASGASGAAAENAARLFGIISPITEHFCDTCNRVRLSATGALHSCLAYDDAVDLRAALAEGGEERVVETIRHALAGKRPKHEFGLLGIGGPRKAMIQIGG